MDEYIKVSNAYWQKHNYLSKAAEAGNEGRAFKTNKEYDKAWQSFQTQKEQYISHANFQKFTEPQALALDASVGVELADILRLEGRHKMALVHIMYWLATSGDYTKAQEQKIKAYFNRCKFKKKTLNDVYRFIHGIKRQPDFKLIRDTVNEWN